MYLLKEESDKANGYRLRTKELFNRYFENKKKASGKEEAINEIAESMEAHGALLIEMINFEKDLVNNEVMFFFYADMAKVALNGRNFEIALKYAQAGIEANEKQGDIEGIRANKSIILNTAVFSKAINEAVKFINENPEFDEPGLIQFLKKTNSTGDENFKKMMKSEDRPESLRLCLNSELRAEERAIRSIMNQMGVSRKEALKYKEVAKEFIEKGELPQ